MQRKRNLSTEEVLLRIKEQRNILHEISKRKANCFGHILRRNCLLRQVIEGKIKEGIEVTERRGRRRRKLLDDLKERRVYSILKEEALDRTMCRARFRRGFEPVVRQTTKWMNEQKCRKHIRSSIVSVIYVWSKCLIVLYTCMYEIQGRSGRTSWSEMIWMSCSFETTVQVYCLNSARKL
jgi:hypothetical protein